MTIWKLTPSDLTFGFECRSCFYAKFRLGWQKPYMPFPSVFGRLDRAMREYWNGRSTTEFCPQLPNGTLQTKEIQVKSKVMTLPGRTEEFFISGKTDCLIHMANHEFAIPDFKTSAVKPELIDTYRPQLHCYAWGLELPDPKKQRISPITRLGLMVYEPRAFLSDHVLEWRREWIEIPRDDRWFADFLSQVLAILESPYEPRSKDDCKWCELRRRVG
ncbi:MAG TPA: PD-(D/E)XK nuclease family protein [Allocoleopsis sp.]